MSEEGVRTGMRGDGDGGGEGDGRDERLCLCV